MKKNIICCLSVILIALSASAQSDSATAWLSQIPYDGVPLAQAFDSRVPDPAVYRQHANKVYYIWGARSPQQPDGVMASKYFPSMRNPDRKRTIDWYKEHHPDWIMYQEDRVTPAYGFIYSWGGATPLDISNPEVREYYMNEFILPAIKAGYKMVAMDNVSLSNMPKCVGHYSGTKWVPLYSGKRDDPAFQKDLVSWIEFLRDRLHPLDVSIAANIKATTAPKEIRLRMLNAVDVWGDETGFSHGGKNLTDASWEREFSSLMEITPSKGYFGVNQVNGTVEEAPHEQIEWVIANFLLCRGPKSMLSVAGFDMSNKKAMYQQFNYRPEMDVNIGKPLEDPRKDSSDAWMRAYQKGMVLVNPSSKDTVTVKLPKGKWKTLNGDTVSGTVVLQPASGAVLTKK
ncbi:hypothetical protein FW774_09220 [Pedobacter sp. BS3]|uniref:putative glycoside hydrolase n=1 Tax=Pedobacter sp. BS3 TaxID=2567937 RepID=UPI0011ED32B3|nr:putative glycoside hydrolase [Pedobacter sp. BS3]TZF83646.1 hypothetical protein FW774_09220 [Pedobacter sp. BS3]